MVYEIKKLTPELADDYIDFFETSAFCNGSEFTDCYFNICQYYTD